MAVRRVAILGATGSIGEQALDVIAADATSATPVELRCVALSAGTRWERVTSQAHAFNVRHILLADTEAAAAARASDHVRVHETVGDLLDASEPDVVLNAVVGAAGLAATLAALERGIDVALANKESLVAAGALCMEVAARHGARIIPVDSEHSALQQCLGESRPEAIDSLVLTASGGPFFGRDREQLARVTIEQALDHPTWNMGGKITIDSATLMNKGLEVIEACVLFDMPVERVETVVHRHSIVHALVRHTDGSMLAHLGWPDMRVPIAWALHWPYRPAVAQARRLDLTEMPALEFFSPDLDAFRCLALARTAASTRRGMPCVLNAANEVAVAAFLAGSARFVDIAEIVEAALDTVGAPGEPDSLDAALEVDARARTAARAHMNALA